VVCAVSFSALQRAENSSIVPLPRPLPTAPTFQCSSASRKFLNSRCCARLSRVSASFSALQRAENSSIGGCEGARATPRCKVSVLFSEPKIPQLRGVDINSLDKQELFQCSSASRKFLNRNSRAAATRALAFQCSSASRKFLNVEGFALFGIARKFQCSSASRKFLNTTDCGRIVVRYVCFSALQRAENSSMRSWRKPKRSSA